MAPANTVNLGCLIAIIAAIKNVLSPISDTSITLREATKACTNPTFRVFGVLPGAATVPV